MPLPGASRKGARIVPGHEPEIAPGIRGILFDRADGIYIPLIRSVNPDQGVVSKFVDDLPTDRKVIFPCVMSPALEHILTKRGFKFKVIELGNEDEGDPEPVAVECMVREAT